MPDNTLRLNTLLGLADEGVSQKMLTIGIEQGDLDSMKALVSAIQGWTWAGFEQKIFQGFSNLLNTDLFDLITATWNQYHVLAEYAQKSKTEGQIASVELIDHTMTIELQPYLEIYIAGIHQPKLINFDVSLDLTLKGLKLNIGNGRIKSVETGSCEGEAEIEINKISLPMKPSFGPIDLPGKINLGEGIAIA